MVVTTGTNGDGSAAPPTDDYPDTSASTGTVNRQPTGTIEVRGDRDAFNVSLVAGQTYAFIVRGTASGGGTLGFPALALRDSAGNAPDGVLTTFYGRYERAATFTAPYDGTWTLIVSDSGPPRAGTSSGTGTYTVAALPTARGTPGADTLADTPDNVRYDGGAGRDVLVLGDAGLRATTVVWGDRRSVMLVHAGQTDVAVDVEEIRFIDGRLVFDASDPAAQVSRLYWAGLGRPADQADLNTWVANIQAGAPLASLAAVFLASAEFTARFGAGLGNQAFVARAYRAVLYRDPDAAGLAFWTGALDTGAGSRAEVLAGISESAENRDATAGLLTSGIWDRSEAARQVARLYDTALGRLPDAGGLAYWAGELDAGATLAGIAQSFTASAEFAAAYGALGNGAFVEAVYRNALGRAGDAEGVAYWTGQLDAGASRAAVAAGFSESTEHQVRTAAAVGGESYVEWGVRLVG